MNTNKDDSQYETKKNIVVMGGGTGTYTVLNGIKHIPNTKITAIVSSADSGGSTGVLRDHFGQLPVGDFRQCLVALAKTENGDNLLRELFQYRFSKGGKGLVGHNFGNLFLTALSDILGSEELAFQKASKILNIHGRVFPVTYDHIQLIAEYEDGTIGYGEAYIDEPPEEHDGAMKIKKLWVSPEAVISIRAEEALENADFIIIGPGDLYTSILANVVVPGVAEAIKSSNAKIVYISNLVSKWGQTDGFNVSDYVREIERYLDSHVHSVIVNDTPLQPNELSAYKEEKSHIVENDMDADSRVTAGDFLFQTPFKQSEHDATKRSLLRHDSEKLSKTLQDMMY